MYVSICICIHPHTHTYIHLYNISPATPSTSTRAHTKPSTPLLFPLPIPLVDRSTLSCFEFSYCFIINSSSAELLHCIIPTHSSCICVSECVCVCGCGCILYADALLSPLCCRAVPSSAASRRATMAASQRALRLHNFSNNFSLHTTKFAVVV